MLFVTEGQNLFGFQFDNTDQTFLTIEALTDFISMVIIELILLQDCPAGYEGSQLSFLGVYILCLIQEFTGADRPDQTPGGIFFHFLQN